MKKQRKKKMPEDNSIQDIAQDVTPVVPTPTPEPTPVVPAVEPTPVVPEPVVVPEPAPVVVPAPTPAPVPEPVVVPTPVVVPEPVVVPTPKEDFVAIPPTETVENFNKHGEPTVNPNDAVVAKKVVSGNSTVFKLAFYGSSLYNPVGPFSTREKAIKNNFKYLVVDEADFKTFLMFLETRNLNTYYTINRKVLNNV